MPTKTWNGSDCRLVSPRATGAPQATPAPPTMSSSTAGKLQLLSGDAAINVKSITFTGGFLAIQDPGKIQSVSGNVSLTGSGSLAARRAEHWRRRRQQHDDRREADQQQHQRQRHRHRQHRHHVGRHCDGERDRRALQHRRQINIDGSAAVQATLNVANAAAGFGTKGVETGTVFLTNDALLEFKSGQITTINGEL